MPSESKRLLLVDGDASRGGALEGVFRELNFDIVSVQNAGEGVEALRKGGVDLLLASIDPTSKGFDLCRLVRESGQLKSTRVVLMGSSPDTEALFSQHQSQGAKADGYVRCPVPPEDIVDWVERLIGLPPPPNGTSPLVAAATPEASAREIEELQEQIHFYQKQLEQVSLAGEKESHEMDKVLNDLQEEVEASRKEKSQLKDEIQLLKTDLAKKDRELKEKDSQTVAAREDLAEREVGLREEVKELREAVEKNEDKHKRAQSALREYYKPKVVQASKLEKTVSVLEDELVKMSGEVKKAKEKVQAAEKELEQVKEDLQKEKSKAKKIRETLEHTARIME